MGKMNHLAPNLSFFSENLFVSLGIFAFIGLVVFALIFSGLSDYQWREVSNSYHLLIIQQQSSVGFGNSVCMQFTLHISNCEWPETPWTHNMYGKGKQENILMKKANYWIIKQIVVLPRSHRSLFNSLHF